MKTKKTLQKIIDYGLLSTLFIFPLTVNIALISPQDPGHPLISINFSVADLIIGILAILWIIKIIKYREYGQIKFPQIQILVFVGIGILSFVNAFSISEWAKEILQMMNYFILFYLLIINNLKNVDIFTIKNTFFITSSIILIIAFVQHTILDSDVYLVCGLFKNHNILGAFLCMVVPVIYIELLHTHKIRKIWMIFLTSLSIVVLTSGSALFSILISITIISCILGKKTLIRFFVILTLLGVLYPFILPSKNFKTILEFASIYEQGSINKNFYCRFQLIKNSGKTTLFLKNLSENYIHITSNQIFAIKINEPEKGERYKDMENQKHIKNRYLEMQASINMISENTLLGVGAGNFQKLIGTYYNVLPKVNTAEPGQHNGYLIIGSTMGILGLTSLLWLLFSILKNTKQQIFLYTKEGIYYLGLFGCVVALLIENLFVFLLITDILVPFIFIIYLSFYKNKSLNGNL